MKTTSIICHLTAISLGLSFILFTGQPDVYGANEPTLRTSPSAETGLSSTPQRSLDETIKTWIATLGKQPSFEQWEHAKWTVHTLGPGTHGWIVELYANQKPVGYLIVGATEDSNYKLMEYGQGESPLFSEETLAHSLSLNPEITKHSAIQAERYYYGALQALWKIDMKEGTIYLDAKTGEELPIEELPAMESRALPNVPSQLTELLDQQIRNAFDPYERLPWVMGTPMMIQNLSDLQQTLNSHRKLTFVGDGYDHQHLVPLSVVGYAHWETGTEPYLAVEQNGIRYIPLSTAITEGAFYQ